MVSNSSSARLHSVYDIFCVDGSTPQALGPSTLSVVSRSVCFNFRAPHQRSRFLALLGLLSNFPSPRSLHPSHGRRQFHGQAEETPSLHPQFRNFQPPTPESSAHIHPSPSPIQQILPRLLRSSWLDRFNHSVVVRTSFIDQAVLSVRPVLAPCVSPGRPVSRFSQYVACNRHLTVCLVLCSHLLRTRRLPFFP